MASRTFLFLALVASTISMILSIPQFNPGYPRPSDEVVQVPNVPVPDPVDPNILVADNVPHINPRTFGSLFNLSSYLATAPNDSAALNFIPLITILSALG